VIRFSQINRLNKAGYNPNYQRHHLIPKQAGGESELTRVFQALGDQGFSLEDFEHNGILLPCCEKESMRTGRPLHRGPHPRYNEIVIERLLVIAKLGNRFDGFEQMLEFIQFRLSLLQSSLRLGLSKRRFGKLHLNLRDPLRSMGGFDQMDLRIEQLQRDVGSQSLESR
jgi:A nuclease family of the HNH/ENDO VII superfamily with conserved AHH